MCHSAELGQPGTAIWSHQALRLLSEGQPRTSTWLRCARAAARRLANRSGDLGDAITADLRQPLDRSIPVDFTLPDCSDVTSIGEYGLQQLNAIIGAYEAFLNQVRGTDDLSFHLVLDLLAAETHQRADLQVALARRS